MCGLAGILGRTASAHSRRDLLRKMMVAIEHRGPDGYGEFLDAGVTMGLQRLCIVDIELGVQTMFSEDKRYVLVCNGEIYNQADLRDRFKGYAFKTNCDVEVLLPLYRRYGPSFLNEINGQFAMAIYDRREESLFLARDQFGICPLFYTQIDGHLMFASEIKSLLAHPDVSRQLDLTGLDQLITLPGLVGSRTMFQAIHSIPPGHYLTSGNGQVGSFEYWDLDYPREQEVPEQPSGDNYVEKTAELLQRSVAYRLQADVPVGFFLSGGLDSSIIAAMIKQASPAVARHSFSAIFDDPRLTESRFQRKMSHRVGSIHHEILVDDQCIAQGLKKAVYHAESPFKELYNTASLALSAATRANGVRVVLNGEGSDELFAGYVGYKFDKNKAYNGGRRSLEDALGDEIRDNLWGDVGLQYDKDERQLPALKEALYSRELFEQLDTFDCSLQPVINKDRIRDRHPVHKRSYLDFKLRLAGHLISDHGDRMTMANSVEGRFPFLDPALVDFMRYVPAGKKLDGFEEKKLLKDAAGSLIPDEIRNREKFGFRAPGSSVLLRQNLEWMSDLLSYDTIKRQGFFNPDTVTRLRNANPSLRSDDIAILEEDILTIVVTFGLFKEHFDVPNL
jgi:asparagine synthase (glutamine-hydrolysing)